MSGLRLGLIACVFAACGSEVPETGSDGAVADVMDSVGGSVGCLAADAPAVLSTSEGNRVVFRRETFTADGGARFEASGRARLLDFDTRLVVRAPYGPGSEDDGVAIICSDGTAHHVPLETTPITWNLLHAGDDGVGPRGREYFAWWLDPVDTGRIWLYGGFVYEPVQFTPNQELWSFDVVEKSWQSHGVLPGAPEATGGRVAQGATAQSVFFQGGITVDSDTPSLFRSLDFAGETPVWSDIDVRDTATPASYTGALVHDARRNRWLSICGVNQTSGPNCRVAEFTETGGWKTLRVDGTRPRGRFGFAYGHDEENDRVVIFGGQYGAANEAVDGETWTLELGGAGPRWVRLFEANTTATGRRNGAWALDTQGARLFVWGGTPDGATSVPGIQVLHLDPGHEQWHAIATPANVPSRTSGAGIHDAERGVIYWGFGNDRAVYRDVWAMTVR